MRFNNQCAIAMGTSQLMKNGQDEIIRKGSGIQQLLYSEVFSSSCVLMSSSFS